MTVMKVIEAIEEFVNEVGPSWKDKVKVLYEYSDSDQEMALDEFIAWFGGQDVSTVYSKVTK